MWYGFAVKLLVVTHFAEKAKLKQPQDTSNGLLVGVITTSRLWGHTSLLLIPGAENSGYATDRWP